jgi:hypothetical protein
MYAVAALLVGIALYKGTKEFIEALHMKRLVRLENLEPLANKTKVAQSARGPADATARGTANNDASLGRTPRERSIRRSRHRKENRDREWPGSRHRCRVIQCPFVVMLNRVLGAV